MIGLFLRHLGHDLGGFLEGVICRRHAAIDRLLQDDFLDVGFGKSTAGQRRPHVQAEFVPLAERDHGAEYQHAAGALVVMRARPDLAPRLACDQFLALLVERRLLGIGAVDPFRAQHLAAFGHAAVVAFFLVHRPRSYCRKLSTASVKALGCSTLEICAASSATSLAPLICLTIASPQAGGVAGSCLPTITRVGAVMRGLDSRKSKSRTASTQPM